MFAFHFYWFFFSKVYVTKYHESMTDKEKLYYYSLWGANTHHVVICIIAFKNAIWPQC